MAPASFLARGSSSALTSSIEAKPPEAITGIEMRSASAIVASRLRPLSRPSRAMSVKMIAATPASSNRCAISSAVTCEVSAQPSTATLPSRASRPTATRPGNFFAAPFTSSGSRTAAVPMMTRVMPLSSQASMVCEVADAAAELHRHRDRLQHRLDRLGVHRLAGERAVEIDHVQIFEALRGEGSRLRRRIEIEHGGARHVALLQAHALAVLQINRWKENHGFHFKKLEIRARPKRWLFSGVKLGADRGVLADDRGHRPAIVGARQHVRLVGGVEVIGVHEIGVAPLRPERQPLQHRDARGPCRAYSSPYAGPSGSRRAARSCRHRRAIQLKPSVIDVLLAARRHQLHADADAEERPRLDPHRLGRAPPACRRPRRRPRRQSANAPTPGSTMRSARYTASGSRVTLMACGSSMLRARALEGFRRRMQIAGAVIDDCNGSSRSSWLWKQSDDAALRQRRGFENDWPGTSRVGGGPPRSTDRWSLTRPRCRAVQRSKKRRSAASSLSATHDVELAPFAPRQRPALQARRLEPEQQHQHQVDEQGSRRGRCRAWPGAIIDREGEDEPADQRQPEPVPGQPEHARDARPRNGSRRARR